jgi:hypothetical protein
MTCRVCSASLLAAGSRYCIQCKSYQHGKDCVACGVAMPADIKRCPTCKAFQGFFRRRIPGSEVVLALLVTLLSVLSGFLPQLYKAWNYRSATRVHVLGVREVPETSQEDYVVLVQAFNTGGRPAVVRTADVRFEGLPIETLTDAKVINPEKMVLLPNEPVILQLAVPGLTTKLPQKAILAQLDLAHAETKRFPHVHVDLHIDETTRRGATNPLVRSGDCVAKRLKGFFKAYVPE